MLRKLTYERGQAMSKADTESPGLQICNDGFRSQRKIWLPSGDGWAIFEMVCHRNLVLSIGYWALGTGHWVQSFPLKVGSKLGMEVNCKG